MRHFIKSGCLLVLTVFITSCQQNFRSNSLNAVASIIISIIVLLFILLAVYSNLLRDEVSDCDEFDENMRKMELKQKRKLLDKSNPFSLTKVQFGIWTVIIASSYIYLSLFKGDCANGAINKTALVLMGIFAGTTVATKIIDKKEIDNNQARHQNTPWHGFFIDILSDENGISLHRFQNLVWTLIAMTVYLYKLSNINTGCMLPELSDTLLTLSGISNATYIIMRSQENNLSKQQQQLESSAPTDTKIISPETV